MFAVSPALPLDDRQLPSWPEKKTLRLKLVRYFDLLSVVRESM
jgi:hypothetical protein